MPFTHDKQKQTGSGVVSDKAIREIKTDNAEVFFMPEDDIAISSSGSDVEFSEEDLPPVPLLGKPYFPLAPSQLAKKPIENSADLLISDSENSESEPELEAPDLMAGDMVVQFIIPQDTRHEFDDSDTEELEELPSESKENSWDAQDIFELPEKTPNQNISPSGNSKSLVPPLDLGAIKKR